MASANGLTSSSDGFWDKIDYDITRMIYDFNTDYEDKWLMISINYNISLICSSYLNYVLSQANWWCNHVLLKIMVIVNMKDYYYDTKIQLWENNFGYFHLSHIHSSLNIPIISHNLMMVWDIKFGCDIKC